VKFGIYEENGPLSLGTYYSVSYQLVRGASQVQRLFFAMSQFGWTIAKTSWNYRGSQNRRFRGKMACLPLWPTYIGEKGWTLCKTYGLKRGAIWGIYWEPDGNPLGTWREHIGSKGKWKKSPPPQNLKEKKSRHFECMLSLPLGCMKFLFPKLFVTIFGLG
jgi:hypothetical protein